MKQFKLSRRTTYKDRGGIRTDYGELLSVIVSDEDFPAECVLKIGEKLVTPCWYCRYGNDTKTECKKGEGCIAYQNYVELLEQHCRDSGFLV